MATTYVPITDLVTSSAYSFPVTVPGVPSGATITKAYCMVKQRVGDADGAALISLTITTTQTSAGQITDAGASGTGTLLFTPTAAQTAALTAGYAYPYAIKVILSNGSPDEVQRGPIEPLPAYITATS